jgi:hypothetical protein
MTGFPPVRGPFFTSPLGANIDPRGWSCSKGVKLSPRGEVVPQGWISSPRNEVIPWGRNSLFALHSSKQYIESVHPWGRGCTKGWTFPLGDKFHPWKTSSPLGAKFNPWGPGVKLRMALGRFYLSVSDLHFRFLGSEFRFDLRSWYVGR